MKGGGSNSRTPVKGGETTPASEITELRVTPGRMVPSSGAVISSSSPACGDSHRAGRVSMLLLEWLQKQQPPRSRTAGVRTASVCRVEWSGVVGSSRVAQSGDDRRCLCVAVARGRVWNCRGGPRAGREAQNGGGVGARASLTQYTKAFIAPICRGPSNILTMSNCLSTQL